MGSLNINSLCEHIDELRALMTGQPLDILAIDESKRNDADRDGLLNLPGYTVIRRDRNKFGGGVLCLFTRFYNLSKNARS